MACRFVRRAGGGCCDLRARSERSGWGREGNTSAVLENTRRATYARLDVSRCKCESAGCQAAFTRASLELASLPAGAGTRRRCLRRHTYQSLDPGRADSPRARWHHSVRKPVFIGSACTTRTRYIQTCILGLNGACPGPEHDGRAAVGGPPHATTDRSNFHSRPPIVAQTKLEAPALNARR